ncbi:MAG: cupin domain-containing protein [Actinomycetes bacterium]|jgi:mannose-6-phosphate isomerase-like protein (cupin superfamily)
MNTNPSNYFPGVVRTVADLAATSRGEAKIFDLVQEGEYAEALTASEIHLDGDVQMGTHDNGDLLLFVREGEGTLTVDGESFELSPNCAALIRSGESWALSSTSPFKIFSVHAPGIGPHARKIAKAATGFQRVVKQGITNKGTATGNREFEVLFDESRGSTGATMFIGFIPTSGAPAHYHLYDEICHIVRGGGAFVVGESKVPIGPGSTFLVVPRMLHSVMNDREEDLWILGTFRPAGSPAAAYYPDGRPAPGYDEV